MSSVLAPLREVVASLLGQTEPLPLRKDGRNHLIADPPMTRTAAVQWLWEGRLDPPEERFRADPQTGSAEDPQNRFLFEVTADEFVEARDDFCTAYLAGGPGWTLEDKLNAWPWLPQSVKSALLQMDADGELRASKAPRVMTFPGQAPWGKIVAWVGNPFELKGFTEIQIFQYFPASETFYQQIAGGAGQKAHLLHAAYTSWNRDMEYFVEKGHMKPSDARDEILRINTEIFKSLLEAFAGVISSGGVTGGASPIAGHADETAAAVLKAYGTGRRVFSLAERQELATMVMFRGTTLRLRRGGFGPPDVHDLGLGCYFTPDQALAAKYAAMRGTADDPAVILKATVSLDELGNVLDLVNGPYAKRWNEKLDELRNLGAPIANENYNKLFMGYLDEIGHKLDEFDAVIAPEALRGGVQINVRRNTVLDKILERAEEIWQS